MPPVLIIRDAEESDREALKAICRISFDRLYAYYASYSLDSSNNVLLGEMEGMVVGFAKLILIRIHDRPLGNILWLAVHPKFRRRGIASALIEASADYFRSHGISDIYVSTRGDNTPALELFQGKGFNKVEFRRLMEIHGHKVIEFYFKMHVSPGEIVLMKTL